MRPTRRHRRCAEDVHHRALPAAVVDGGLGSRRRAALSSGSARMAAPTAHAPRRTLVQARQIYCFAKAAQMGWYPEGKAIALKGLEYLLTKAKAPDGQPGFVHRLGADGDGATIRCATPMTTPSCCWRWRRSMRSTAMRRSVPRSTRCCHFSTPNCARRMAASRKDFRRRCRGGRTRRCICSKR